MRSIIFLAVLALVSAPVAVAQPRVAPDELNLQAERVVVFKDGYCMVVKRGQATADQRGMVYTHEVPDAAVLGSFWATATKGEIVSMTAGWDEQENSEEKEVACTRTLEVIAANIGKNCSFRLHQDTIRGEILQVLGNETEQEIDPALMHHLRASEDPFASIFSSEGSAATIFQQTGDQFIVRTEAGDMLVSASSIQQLVIDDMQTKLTKKLHAKQRRKQLRLQFAEPNQAVEIMLVYFRPGVRWVPTYRIDLPAEGPAQPAQAAVNVKANQARSERKQAQLHLQGEILNEAEDLIDVPFDLVVGVPNFRFRDTPSPMVLEGVMRNALNQAAPNLMGQQVSNQFSNSMFSQRASETRGSGGMEIDGGESSAVEMPEALTTQGTNDLFVYHLQKLSLKKGERATLPILSTQVPYRDVYTWDVHLQHNETFLPDDGNSRSPLVLSENKVWRQIELVNQTKLPWTTGAAMFVEGYQPLAQELLTYTSPGSTCRIPVTVAVDLRAQTEDVELDRVLNATTFRGSSYARVKGRVDVELINNKPAAVPVEIRVRFGGRATEAEADGKIRLSSFLQDDWKNYRGEPAINNSSEVTWHTTIPGGESFAPSVQYEFFLWH